MGRRPGARLSRTWIYRTDTGYQDNPGASAATGYWDWAILAWSLSTA
jgi:hypothetical protein